MNTIISKLLLTSSLFFMLSAFVRSPDAPIPVTFNTKVEAEANIGGAYLTFADKFGGEVSQHDLVKHQRVEVSGCAKGSKIFQFTIYITKKGKTTSLQTKSSNLTDEMLTALRTLSKGDEFEFKKVKAYLPNGKDVVDVWAKKFVVV